MEHVVFYPSADGSPAFHRVASLEDAVRVVEHLRNVEGVGEFSVHAMTPVPLAVRAYYRVEVPAEAAPTPAPAVEPVEPVQPVQPVQPVEPVAVEPDPVAEMPVVEPAEQVAEMPAEVAAVAEVPVPSQPMPEETVEANGSRKSLGFFAR